MGGMQSTVLRLERQIQQDNARALTALHQQYDALTAAVLQAARGRGYLGNDPLGAIGHFMLPPSTGRQYEAQLTTRSITTMPASRQSMGSRGLRARSTSSQATRTDQITHNPGNTR